MNVGNLPTTRARIADKHQRDMYSVRTRPTLSQKAIVVFRLPVHRCDSYTCTAPPTLLFACVTRSIVMSRLARTTTEAANEIEEVSRARALAGLIVVVVLRTEYYYQSAPFSQTRSRFVEVCIVCMLVLSIVCLCMSVFTHTCLFTYRRIITSNGLFGVAMLTTSSV